MNDARKPLRSRLLAVPALRARYLDHVRTIAEEWLDWNKLKPVVDQYRSLIEKEVEADTRKLTSFAAFQKAVGDAPPTSSEPRAGGPAWASRLLPKVGASSCSTIRKSRRPRLHLDRVCRIRACSLNHQFTAAIARRDANGSTLTWGDLMPEWLHTSLANGSDPSLTVLAWRIGMAMALGAGVAVLYRWARRGETVQPTFLTTLVLLATVIAMATQVIGDNVARAFSLVGALSVVRFRTVVKDTQDTAFVIFAVVVGMASGANHLVVALVGMGMVAARHWCFGRGGGLTDGSRWRARSLCASRRKTASRPRLEQILATSDRSL